MNSLSKSITAGLLTIFAGCLLTDYAQADEGAGHGPVPFSVFDMDHSGTVSETEFNSVREQRMAARASEGRHMRCAKHAPSFADLDTDGSGELNQQELTAGQNAHRAKCKTMGQGKGKGMGMKGNMPAFSDFDVDGDGVIVESEFNEGHAKKMAEMAAQGHKMKHAGDAPGFSGIDSNGDGGISEQEFSDHQAAHHQHGQGQHDKKD